MQALDTMNRFARTVEVVVLARYLHVGDRFVRFFGERKPLIRIDERRARICIGVE